MIKELDSGNPHEIKYASELAHIRRTRTRYCLWTLIGLLISVDLLILPTEDLPWFPISAEQRVVLALVLLAIVVIGNRILFTKLQAARCPRCGEKFFSSQVGCLFWISACLHCNIKFK